VDATDRVVLGIARTNATDGTRMVAALAAREARRPVNRKRVQRLMREHRLLQPKRSEGHRRRPGYFQVTRPNELWHVDMTSVWVAEHGWCYLHATIDCCTREIVGWALDLRCRAAGATAVIDAAVAERGLGAGELMLGSDNGTAFTSRAFRAPGWPSTGSPTAAAAATATRNLRRSSSRGFSKLKQRCIWREEFETLDEARAVIGAYVDAYQHRPHPGPGLPHAGRSRPDLEGSARPVNPSGLTVNADGSTPDPTGRSPDS